AVPGPDVRGDPGPAGAAVPGTRPPARRVPGDQAPDVLPGRGTAAGGAPGGGPAQAPARRAGRARVRAVLRGREPAGPARPVPPAVTEDLPDQSFREPVQRPPVVRGLPHAGRTS